MNGRSETSVRVFCRPMLLSRLQSSNVRCQPFRVSITPEITNFDWKRPTPCFRIIDHRNRKRNRQSINEDFCQSRRLTPLESRLIIQTMAGNLTKRTLGKTGLDITQLGYGAMELRGRREEITEKDAERLLNTVLDSGITFIDTSPDYGLSEERIGKYISHRRNEFYLSTKCGCNITYPDGVRQDPSHLWNGDVIRRNIEKSLERMKVDYVDILQMHNPSFDDVVNGGLVEVLEEIRDSGKTRFIGVSSTAPNLMGFARMGVFDSFQIPYSLLERQHENMIKAAAELGAGIIIRGGVAKGHRESGERWDKWERAGLNDLLHGMNRYEFVLRFTLSHLECHTTIVGTADLNHLKSNVASADAGALAEDIYAEAAKRLEAIGESPLEV